MISRRRYRRKLQTLDCCGLSSPIRPSSRRPGGSGRPGRARGPPQWAEVHEGHLGQFTGPVMRSRGGGGTTGPS
jgi:hypothetical protein